MEDRNGCTGRSIWLGFTESEVKQRPTSIDPDDLRIFELTAVPLRRLLCSRQSLAMRFRAESRATGYEDSAEQCDQQSDSESRPKQQAQRPAAGYSIRFTVYHQGHYR